MLKASVGFFALSLLSLFLGWRNLGGVTFELGRSLLLVFLAFSLVTFLVSLASRGGQKGPARPA